jgi:PAS domain S-box-containing protein
MNLNYSPVLEDDGTPLAILAVVMETTPRVLAERALAESREKLDLALNASGLVGVWDWDIPADRVTGDERFAALVRMDAREAGMGVPIARILAAVHPLDRERVGREIQLATRRGGDARIETRLWQADGQVCWVVASGRMQLDRDGRAIRFRGVVVDISDQKRASLALSESEARFRTLADTMPQMVWTARSDGHYDYCNARWYDFTGTPRGTEGEVWSDLVHPEDSERVWEAWRYSLATGEPYRVEYRLRHRSGDYRWVLAQALPMRDEYRRISRWFGTYTDIHESRLVAEERDVVAQELSHRIKNIFAVITGIIALSARNHPESKAFAAQLRERIVALGRAHDFVRPHSQASIPISGARSLHALVGELLGPYRQEGDERLVFTGEDAPIDDGTATPFALLFHELATNAAKYGALSREEGRVVIATAARGDTYSIVWRETGGPPLEVAPELSGFGSKLVSLSVEGQLEGRLVRHWDRDGLRVEIEIPLGVLSRSGTLQTRRQ